MVGIAVLATLIAVIYTEEDWRGRRAWENCKRELEAKGAVLDWDKYIPPTVPDDRNFFKAPKMADWFVRGHNGTELQDLLQNSNTVSVITNETAANDYLAWSDKLQPQFDLIREALKRPYARMDGDYSKPFEQPIPNFISVRIVTKTLAQRAKCDLLLGQPDKALQELTLLHDFLHLVEAAPTGKPMTLVSAMINVAVTGFYVDTIAGGLQSRAWQEPQLAALQKQLADINLTPFVAQAFREEQVGICRDAEVVPLLKLFSLADSRPESWFAKVIDWLWPRGWTYQNMVNIAVLDQKSIDGFDLAQNTVAPRKFEEAWREIEEFDKSVNYSSPYKILAAIAIPNFVRAEQTTAHTQTLVNAAQIACALERYHLAHCEYPATFDALTPQFLEKIPHDIIGGQPLHYRRTDDGKFVLYSVGWNETDDGGVDSSQVKSDKGTFAEGDWVWRYPAQ